MTPLIVTFDRPLTPLIVPGTFDRPAQATDYWNPGNERQRDLIRRSHVQQKGFRRYAKGWYGGSRVPREAIRSHARNPRPASHRFYQLEGSCRQAPWLAGADGTEPRHR